jgi:DNA-binding protein H-NS
LWARKENGTAIISAIIAIISILLANKNSKQLQVTDQRYQIAMKEMDLKHSEKISELESKLATKRDKETARREYEYDARKKLYEAYEPLLFQFNELAENALRRVIALARASRQGKLEGK